MDDGKEVFEQETKGTPNISVTGNSGVPRILRVRKDSGNAGAGGRRKQPPNRDGIRTARGWGVVSWDWALRSYHTVLRRLRLVVLLEKTPSQNGGPLN